MLCIDACVWVAAADPKDSSAEASRTFFAEVARRDERICVPTFARVEIACALARRIGDAMKARSLVAAMLDSRFVVQVPMDPSLLDQAFRGGTEAFLRGADALYAATAAMASAVLITWDEELLRRADAITPSDWLAAATAP